MNDARRLVVSVSKSPPRKGPLRDCMGISGLQPGKCPVADTHSVHGESLAG